jgi:hypothetical protein
MKILLQPAGSKTCGHHCVAMISKRSVEDVTKIIGHSKGTYTIELHRAFAFFSIYTDKRLTRVKGENIPDTCILKIKWKKGGHWVVHHRGNVYDPAYGIYPFRAMNRYHSGRATSYLKILLPESSC